MPKVDEDPIAMMSIVVSRLSAAARFGRGAGVASLDIGTPQLWFSAGGLMPSCAASGVATPRAAKKNAALRFISGPVQTHEFS